jgi:hypothetical protein
MATKDDICYDCGHPLGDDAPNAVEARPLMPTTIDQVMGQVQVEGPDTVLHPACYAANTTQYKRN